MLLADKPDGQYDGLYLGEPRTETKIDLNAIPPNGKRPLETGETSWVFPGKPGID